jgi:predicted negative regulator of RcsB-dependent stress response
MVDVNLSEEEQVEALKKWWKENGRSVIGGVVIGLGAVFGWQYWTEHQQNLANQASIRFEQLNQSVAAGAYDAAEKQAAALINDHQGTPYALFSALELAKVKLAGKDTQGALAQLQWVVENSSEAGFTEIARLRMARIQLAEGNTEAASSLIAAAGDAAFGGEYAELRGDVARAKGDIKAARAAYREALSNAVSNASLVQMKLDDLPASATL